MSLKITVLTPTCRPQYLEYQVEALIKQTFRDFEWVLVDDEYIKNQHLYQIVGGGFPLTHLQTRNLQTYPTIASACNQGLTWAKGELIYFMNDYVIPEPTVLERHWELYQRFPKAMISGRGKQVAFPKPGNNYSDSPDYRLWLFENGFFKWDKIEDGLYEAYRDGIQNWWAGRNDSAPLEALIKCNGFDDIWDGRWGGQDACMAQRLMTYGLRYLIDLESICLEFDHIHGIKQAIRTEVEQQALQESIIDSRVQKGVFTSGNVQNLKEERKLWLQV